MNHNGETTAQRLSHISYQRKAVAGVLRYRLSRSPEFQYPAGDADSCIGYLLQYASEEHRLRLRMARKASAARGEGVSTPSWRLRYLSGGTLEPTFEIAGLVTVLGRDEHCGLLLPLPWVSRRHARLRVYPEGVHIQDLGSLNGIYVNGQAVKHALLEDGDQLRFGDQLFRLEYIGPTWGSMLA